MRQHFHSEAEAILFARAHNIACKRLKIDFAYTVMLGDNEHPTDWRRVARWRTTWNAAPTFDDYVWHP